MDYLIARFIAWYAAQSVHLIGAETILTGCALSAAAYLELIPDGWPLAFSGFTAPIVVWMGCTWVVSQAERNHRSRD